MGALVAINPQLVTLLVAFVAVVVAGGAIVAFVALMLRVVDCLDLESWLLLGPGRDRGPRRAKTPRAYEDEPDWWPIFERDFAAHVEALGR
jgi:hypothetical protein